MKAFDLWNSVRLGSKVKWRTATGELQLATVIEFTATTSPIICRDEGQSRYVTGEIWVERIEEVDNGNGWQRNTELPTRNCNTKLQHVIIVPGGPTPDRSGY